MSQHVESPVADVVPAMAGSSEAAAAQAMDALIDLDRLILALPELMRGTKALLFQRRIEEVTNLSAALRLTIHLGRPAEEVVQACGQLDVAIRQFALLTDRSRIPFGAQLAVRLVRDLSVRLRTNIAAGFGV